MFRRKRIIADLRWQVQNLTELNDSIRAQLVAASAEFDRRYAELLGNRDEWRGRAKASGWDELQRYRGKPS